MIKRARRLVQANPFYLKRLLNIYPPLRFAGIRVESISNDGLSALMRLRIWPWTANMNGSAFGGSLFSMTDVLYPLLVVQQLGPEYEVWTRNSSFNYISPGRSGAFIRIEVDQQEIQRIKKYLQSNSSIELSHRSVIHNIDESVVGIADHIFHIRRKRAIF